jgi:lactoylglutathione lyase
MSGVTHMFPMLSCLSLTRSLAFYSDLLGGQESYRFPDEGEPEFVALRLGDSELGLGQLTDAPATHGRPQRPSSGHRIELCANVDDVDAAVEKLRATGVTIVLEPADQPWGKRIAYVEDPDGNLVMLEN